MSSPPQNPLLDLCNPPRFGEVRSEQVEPALRARIAEAEAAIDRALAPGAAARWETVLAPIDQAEERLERAWGPVDFLNLVGRDLRRAHREGSELHLAHQSRLLQDERLLHAATALREQPLSAERHKVLGDLTRDLHLAGVHLPQAEKERCAALRVEIQSNMNTFLEQLQDATDAWRLPLSEAQVAPLPEALRAEARATALRDDPQADGAFALTLQSHVITAFLVHQPDRALRGQVYEAFYGRASAPPHDNGPVLTRILALRAELASLLGFGSFSELALQTEMAGSPEEVRGFLLDLADRVRPLALSELGVMARRAAADGVHTLERHDLGFYRERLRREQAGVSDLELRMYFPLSRVLAGLDRILDRLFGLSLSARPAAGEPWAWHPDLLLLELSERGGGLLARILFDPFARPGKRGGAWVSALVPRWLHEDGAREVPLIALVANLPPPQGSQPSLLSHDHVRTLLHELGHALHHGLTEARERRALGTRGVPRDGVELPSKLLEQWVWQPEALEVLSGHVGTGEPLPADLLQRLKRARDLTRGMDVLRQLEIALFDLEVHHRSAPADVAQVREVLAEVRARVAVVPAQSSDRFESSFRHIFAGGYASRYYSYPWADVLAADAFARFEDEGIWSRATGEDLREQILARGGSAPMMEQFIAFRGRRPSVEALLRSIGCA